MSLFSIFAAMVRLIEHFHSVVCSAFLCTRISLARERPRSAEISAGLAQNEWIVQAGVHLLREGESVRAVDADNRPVPMGGAAKAAR